VRRLLALGLLAACSYSNEAILEELDARARAEPAPALDAVAERGGPVPLAAPAHEAVLPMVHGKVPAVVGRVNGVEMPVVLDTGSTHVTLTAEAAREARLHLSAQPPSEVAGAGHTGAHRHGAFRTLELGGIRLGPGEATVAINDRPGRWMDLGTRNYAIVGCSVLSHFRVTFDFEKDEVRLAPTGGTPYTEPLLTRVEINDRPYALLIDSGATTVFLEPWAALELGLITPERARRHEEKPGRQSDALFTRFTLDRVGVAGREFTDVRAAAVNTFGDVPLAHGPRPAGLLGLKGLGKLVWTLDYGNQTVHVCR